MGVRSPLSIKEACINRVTSNPTPSRSLRLGPPTPKILLTVATELLTDLVCFWLNVLIDQILVLPNRIDLLFCRVIILSLHVFYAQVVLRELKLNKREAIKINVHLILKKVQNTCIDST